jgi:hypothetical protein
VMKERTLGARDGPGVRRQRAGMRGFECHRERYRTRRVERTERDGAVRYSSESTDRYEITPDADREGATGLDRKSGERRDETSGSDGRPKLRSSSRQPRDTLH